MCFCLEIIKYFNTLKTVLVPDYITYDLDEITIK